MADLFNRNHRAVAERKRLEILHIIKGVFVIGIANAVFFIPAIDGAWFRVFLGAILLAAVFANERIRKRITGGI